LLKKDIRLVNYLTGSELSNSGNIVSDGDKTNYENIDSNLSAIRELDNDMYFNIKKLNKSILDEDQYSTLLHYDILSKNNKTQNQHLNQGARVYAISNDYNNSYKNYVEAVRLNKDDIMSKIHFAAVCLKLNKYEEFKSLIEDIIKSNAVIKDQQLASRLIGFIVNTPVEINNVLILKFISDLAEHYQMKNLINSDGSVDLSSFKNQASNIENNTIINSNSRNYIELNEKKLNISDFNSGFTIEYWVKKSDENDDFGWLFSNGAEGFGGAMRNGFSILQMNRDTIRFELVNANKGEKTMLDTPMPKNDDWFHMANVWNSFSSEASTYINGKLVGQSKFNGPLIFPESSYNINLGRSYRGWNMSYWAGGLTELRIWKYPRTEREINKYKNSSINKESKGLYEYIMLNQKDGNEIISSITGHKIANFYGPNWKSTKNIPISNGKDFYYASFGSISNNNNDLNQHNTLNWERMSDFGKLQIQLGNYDDAINVLDMVRFKSSNPSTKNDPTYYKTGNPWDLLSVCNAYLKKNDLNTARNLFNNIGSDNLPSESNFNWNGIRFHALMKTIVKRLN